jgi:hypothetical protein
MKNKYIDYIIYAKNGVTLRMNYLRCSKIKIEKSTEIKTIRSQRNNNTCELKNFGNNEMIAFAIFNW